MNPFFVSAGVALAIGSLTYFATRGKAAVMRPQDEITSADTPSLSDAKDYGALLRNIEILIDKESPSPEDIRQVIAGPWIRYANNSALLELAKSKLDWLITETSVDLNREFDGNTGFGPLTIVWDDGSLKLFDKAEARTSPPFLFK